MTITTDRSAARDVGLSGVLAVPADRALGAAVILLGSSEGGVHEKDAQALAADGFTVLALAYFGAPGVPAVLRDVPLEYFFGAVDFLQARGHSKIGVVGGSRGAEAALLLAAHDPRVSTVVSVVGSGVVTPGIDFRLGSLDRILSTPTSAWSLGGQSLAALHTTSPRRCCPLSAREDRCVWRTRSPVCPAGTICSGSASRSSAPPVRCC